MVRHSKEYNDYINSPQWRALRKRVIKRRGQKCQRCRNETETLELHHKHYETLGKECWKDLLLLCPRCHKIKDQERQKEVDADQYNRRFEAWAGKVYGDDWEHEHDRAELEDAFDDWLLWKEE